MPFNAFFGFNDKSFQDQWARYSDVSDRLNHHHGVVSAGALTVSGRVATLASVLGKAPGVGIDGGGSWTIPGGQNTGTLAIEVKHATKSVAPVFLPGSSPRLSVAAGSVWHLPMYRLSAPSGTVNLSASAHFKPCYPIEYRSRLLTAVGQGDGAGQVSTGSVETIRSWPVPDPGWPYWLEVPASARCRPDWSGAIGGYGILKVQLGTSLVEDDYSSRMKNITDWEPVAVHAVTRVVTGPQTVNLVAHVDPAGGLTNFSQGVMPVIQHPA